LSAVTNKLPSAAFSKVKFGTYVSTPVAASGDEAAAGATRASTVTSAATKMNDFLSISPLSLKGFYRQPTNLGKGGAGLSVQGG
jgi:hypothetical protein